VKKECFAYVLMVFVVLPSVAFPWSDCSGDEQPVFTCQIKDKRAEFCYSKLAHNFVYRYKKGNVTQLQYPRTQGGVGAFKFSSTLYAGGGEAHVHFDNGGYSYFIYDKNVKESDGGVNSMAGILVKKGAKTVADMQCENSASIRPEAYELLLKEEYRDIGVQ
jgi:hypothetical protein